MSMLAVRLKLGRFSPVPGLLFLLAGICTACSAAPERAQTRDAPCLPCERQAASDGRRERQTGGDRAAVPAVAPALRAAPPSAIHWVRTSAEYAALCLQAFRAAAERVAVLADKRKKGTWAVVLDADETVLDNSSYQIERHAGGQSFSKESWSAWVRRREAGAVPGALSFMRRVRELGGVIAIVTNRTESECPDTKSNLDALGALHDVLLCKPDSAPPDKSARWQAIADGRATGRSVEIVAYLGDNITDFPGLTQQARQKSDLELGDVGAKFFVLPNPMYGSWESNAPR
jgi:5'-nucleotidase (lipoprotein e(P4) family)